MDTSAIARTDFEFPGQTAVYHGKVRDVYTIGDSTLISVATDRISAFDVILPKPIPFKGQVLNQLAAHFLESTADIVPNWLRAVPDPNVSVGVKAEPVKVEVVVRAVMVGHAWREYSEGKRKLCGVALPEGQKEYDSLPEPIITPTTKADAGHDEDISEEDILKQGLVSGQDWTQIKDYALKLFRRGQEMARARGLVLADTKYEFGLADGRVILIDEVHTPDSSRYFYAEGYNAFVNGGSSEKPKHLSKEFLREWLLERGFSGGAGEPPAMDDGFVKEVSDRYIELYEEMTGEKFVKSSDENPARRIEANILKYLKEQTA